MITYYDKELFTRTLKEFTFYDRCIPDYMHGGIIRYVFDGILPGDFLLGVLTCDLNMACNNADDKNLWLIPVYHSFFFNHIPYTIWGSPQKVFRHTSNRQKELAEELLNAKDE